MSYPSNLYSNINSWQKIDAPTYVNDWIQNGVEIPYSSDTDMDRCATVNHDHL